LFDTGFARGLLRLVAIAVVAYLALLLCLYLLQRQLLYFPDRSRPRLGAALVQLGVREAELATIDRLSLLSWYLPPRDGQPVIAYFHGNGGNIAYRADRMARFASDGYGILMLEYRGYGGNPGKPHEKGLYSDARAALDFLRQQGITDRRIVLYGESLGSGIAVRIAAEQPQAIAALVLEAPFTSIAALARYHYPFVPAGLVRDRYDCLSLIGRVKAPILILYGGRDAVVPARLSRALFAAAPEPKESWFAPDADHGDLARFGALDAVIGFLRRLG
jgi:fermentation-respiration switch protein FrsA (DUF1100 family)